MKRRTFLRTVGVGGVAGVAGCVGGNGDGEETDERATSGNGDDTTGTTTGATESSTPELVVSTYGAFVDAPSTSPGPWLKEAFESEFDATLTYATPDSEINYYIERAMRGADIDADVYVGLNVDMLIRIDEQLDDGLFTAVGDISGQGDVKSGLNFDPDGRIVPYDTSYVSIVYNETFDDGDFVAPETFDGLLESEYAGDLLTQNPTGSATGKSFLLHTIDAKGPDGYLDYWEALQANDVRVLSDWATSYANYEDEEAPMVVSYSTDQVYASQSGEDLAKHQIRFLNDQGYAYPEGMSIFEGADDPELAREFLEFVLRPDVQGEIAQRNVAFPATTTAELPEEFAEYAQAPPEAVTFTYDELRDNVSEWTDAWERQFASK
ncbi:thiamine ABC transporter substrate-binding protein [Halobellus captivus]|uniref:thiamine ABC transporter substrate-binding protein n=1 Tax=Halobellus captivus TaxID=2592614 RepID=UPI0011A46C55|nr:thiamine ABC transporter substrate-binding protein [Halobellus captivus]